MSYVQGLAMGQIMIESYIATLHAPESLERTALLEELAAGMRDALIGTGRMSCDLAASRGISAGEALASIPDEVRRVAALYGVRFGESEAQS